MAAAVPARDPVRERARRDDRRRHADHRSERIALRPAQCDRRREPRPQGGRLRQRRPRRRRDRPDADPGPAGRHRSERASAPDRPRRHDRRARREPAPHQRDGRVRGLLDRARQRRDPGRHHRRRPVVGRRRRRRRGRWQRGRPAAAGRPADRLPRHQQPRAGRRRGLECGGHALDPALPDRRQRRQLGLGRRRAQQRRRAEARRLDRERQQRGGGRRWCRLDRGPRRADRHADPQLDARRERHHGQQQSAEWSRRDHGAREHAAGEAERRNELLGQRRFGWPRPGGRFELRAPRAGGSGRHAGRHRRAGRQRRAHRDARAPAGQRGHRRRRPRRLLRCRRLPARLRPAGPGFPRVQDGNPGGGPACDIGAFEVAPEPAGTLAALSACAALWALRGERSRRRGALRSGRGRAARASRRS